MAADAKLMDVLFVYLALPVATIINLFRKATAMVTLGCIDNVYSNMENITLASFPLKESGKMVAGRFTSTVVE
ncbi:unnamed protein product [Linum trigynum]|uniref:Uncharacterized protein n=1 Tax=Linum trigynum TaxID=586398 RepID=A0AAV2EIL5_9ROSI